MPANRWINGILRWESEVTIVKLTVLLLAVDDVESVWQVSLHIAYFKVEPLMVFCRIHVRHQN